MNFISRKFYEILLRYQQNKVNKLYKSEGMTDKVLDMQVKINRKRHELNLPDRYEMQYKRFVQ